MASMLNFTLAGNTIKIAIPTRGQEVDDHFGHCGFYTVYTISKSNEVIYSEVLESPVGCGCKSNIATTLNEMNVSVMLAGNIGQGAISKLAAAGIQVIRGCKGNVETVISEYLSGKIQDNGETCAHHDDGHVCSHD